MNKVLPAIVLPAMLTMIIITPKAKSVLFSYSDSVNLAF